MNPEIPKSELSSDAPQEIDSYHKSRLVDWLKYFLKLGTLGFGGPIALIGYMQEFILEKNRWVSLREFYQGIAFSQLTPGTLAAKFAMYLAYIRFGIFGATAVGLAFILPSFLMIIPISILYIYFGDLSEVKNIFYCVGAVVIAIVLKSAIKLVHMSVQRDRLLWGLFFVNVVVALWNSGFSIWMFIISGTLVTLIKYPPRFTNFKLFSVALVAAPVFTGFPNLMQGAQGPPTLTILTKIFLYFAWAGSFIFGSSLAIVPFMHNSVVDQYHWLTDKQFLDAVTISIITPGPAVITVAFIGYLVGGLPGALVSAVGIFLPSYLFVVLLTPYYRRYAHQKFVHSFISGTTAAAAGAIVGAAIVLAKGSINNYLGYALFLSSFLIFIFFKKVPDLLVLGVAALIGWLLTEL